MNTNNETQSTAIDPATRIGAVTLNVADLAAQTTFYREVIGLHTLVETDNQVTLGVPGRPLVHLKHLFEGRFAYGTTGLYHFALRVPERADLAHWFRHYIDGGAPNWQGASDHVVSNALYLSDPEGNGIELYWDRPSSTWPVSENGRVAMETRPLDLRALQAGTSSSTWRGLPFGTEMGHIHLKVADTEEAREFYVDILGFELKAHYPGSVLFVAAGSYHHHIGLNSWDSAGAPRPPEPAYGLDSYAILLKSTMEKARLLQRLQGRGYPFDGGPEPAVRDPSGNRFILKISEI